MTLFRSDADYSSRLTSIRRLAGDAAYYRSKKIGRDLPVDAERDTGFRRYNIRNLDVHRQSEC